MAINFGLLQPGASFDQGFEIANRMMKFAAEKHAGQFLKNNDRSRAAGAMADAGYTQEADDILQRGLNQKSTAAATAASEVSTDAAKEKERWAFIQRTTTALNTVAEKDGVEALPQAFDMITPLIRSRGVDENQITVLKQAISDPARAKSVLEGLSRMAGEKLANVPDGGQLRDSVTGALVAENPRDPPPVINVGPNATAVNPTTREVIAEGKDTTKPEPVWKMLTPAEAAQAGFRAGVQVKAKIDPATGAQIDFDVVDEPPASTKADNKGRDIPPGVESAVTKMRDQQAEYDKLLADMDEFMILNKKYSDTGGLMAAPLVKEAVGAFNADVGRMNSLTDHMVPNMRQGLPGAASERDTTRFENATVSTSKKFAANQMTYRAFQAVHARIKDKVDFFEQYALKHGTLVGAQGMWNRYINDPDNDVLFEAGPGLILPRKPSADWRTYLKWEDGETPAPAQGATIKGAVGTPENPIVYEWDDPNSPTRKLVRKN